MVRREPAVWKNLGADHGIRDQTTPLLTTRVFFVEVQLPEIERLATYSGEIGILIFLAAADRALHRRTSPALLEHCYSKVEAFDSGSAPLGIGNGIGGLIYGSLILGELREKPCE